MFAKFFKWLSICFTVLVFTVIVIAAVQNVLTNPGAQTVIGIFVASTIVLFLIFNGIYELIKMGLK